jgi:hypothetical protein
VKHGTLWLGLRLALGLGLRLGLGLGLQLRLRLGLGRRSGLRLWFERQRKHERNRNVCGETEKMKRQNDVLLAALMDSQATVERLRDMWLKATDRKRLCDACGLHPVIWSNSHLLGLNIELCRGCAEDWYEGGIVDPAVMKKNRQKEEAKDKKR